MHTLPLPLALVGLAVVLCLVLRLVSRALPYHAAMQGVGQAGSTENGVYLAEVTLASPFGEGQVVYRERFASTQAADRAAARQAAALSRWLPGSYFDADAAGLPLHMRSGFRLRSSVRPVAEVEGVPVIAVEPQTLAT